MGKSSAQIWNERPELVQNFLERLPQYRQLCDEVKYILEKDIRARNIITASISCRAKTLNSFLEKLQRKDYRDPFKDITDFAGARVVCLYENDIQEIDKIIASCFSIEETVDKASELGSSQFGYLAKHYLVRLNESYSGARYDDLKELICEVQVRTVVQDAWAIIQHHLMYKNEAQIPSSLQRKLNGLAGLFEIADDQFEIVRKQRASYLEEVERTATETNTLLKNELNLDTAIVYLEQIYPNRKVEAREGQLGMVLDALLGFGCKTLEDIDDLLYVTEGERELACRELYPKVTRALDETIPSNFELALALAFVQDPAEFAIPFGPEWMEIVEKHRNRLRPGRGRLFSAQN